MLWLLIHFKLKLILNTWLRILLMDLTQLSLSVRMILILLLIICKDRLLFSLKIWSFKLVI